MMWKTESVCNKAAYIENGSKMGLGDNVTPGNPSVNLGAYSRNFGML